MLEYNKTGWEVIADEIDDADDGDRIVVDMNGTTEVSKSIIEQIKDKNIDLVIELDNGFTRCSNQLQRCNHLCGGSSSYKEEKKVSFMLYKA